MKTRLDIQNYGCIIIIIIIIMIKDIYIAQVLKGHKCAMSQRWQYGYVTVFLYSYLHN